MQRVWGLGVQPIASEESLPDSISLPRSLCLSLLLSIALIVFLSNHHILFAGPCYQRGGGGGGGVRGVRDRGVQPMVSDA